MASTPPLSGMLGVDLLQAPARGDAPRRVDSHAPQVCGRARQKKAWLLPMSLPKRCWCRGEHLLRIGSIFEETRIIGQHHLFEDGAWRLIYSTGRQLWSTPERPSLVRFYQGAHI